MPISVTAPRGVLTSSGRSAVLPRLSTALIAAAGATGNPFVESIVGGTVREIDAADVYAGGRNTPLILVEVTLPAGALTASAPREEFVRAAALIVAECAGPQHDPANTWVSVKSADEGGWAIGPTAYTGERLGAAIAAAAS